MNHALSLNSLNQAAPTRELLTWLCQAYAEKSPEFAQARIVMEKWADELSQADSQQEMFPLLDPGKEITVRSLLGAMGREQASRFLGELFTDIVPHLFSKGQFNKDMEEGRTSSGMEVRRSRLMDPLFRALSQASRALVVRSENRVLNLTWKDDGLNFIQSSVSVSMEVENESSPPPTPRGMSF